MQWVRQTPFLAVLVFGIGIGVGHAWQSGWIPIEFGSADTGSLESEFAGDMVEESSSAPVQGPVESGQEVGFTPPRALSSPEEFRAEGLTGAEIPSTVSQPQSPPAPFVRRQSEPAVTSAVHVASAEPEWAAEPIANRAERIQASTALPRGVGERRQREIQLAANQEPPVAGELAGSKGDLSTSPLASELKTIDEQLSKDEILPAHRALSKLYWDHKDARHELLPRLNRTANLIFFEPRPHFVEPYVVQPNDQLRVIANKYQLSWEYLASLNRTDPRRIQLGQKLKILKGPFSAIVDLNEFALTIHLQGYYVKRYEVGIGKDGASPVGKFTVLNKIENPQYTGPDGKVISGDDPLNPLGERWLDLGDSYGIHGTIEPDSIGKAASRGCIRMREKDVIEVYNFLVKGSEVVIRK